MHLIQEAQQKLMRAKEKALSAMTELRKIYRARGEYYNAEDEDTDVDLCQSRVGKNIQELDAKLREFGKSATKANSDEGSFATKNVRQWWKEERKRIGHREIERFRSDGQTRHQCRPEIEDCNPGSQVRTTSLLNR